MTKVVKDVMDGVMQRLKESSFIDSKAYQFGAKDMLKAFLKN